MADERITISITATSGPWRCPSTNPETPTSQCWLPVDHHGQDAANNWDLHQDAEGNQW